MYTIHRATADDFPAIANVNLVAYAEFTSALPDGAWERMYDSLTNIAARSVHEQFLVARFADGVIGSVAYCPAGLGDPLYFTPEMATLLMLSVHPDHRGKGVARSLALACVARAREDGAAVLGLITSDVMQPAQALYRSMGFRMDGEMPLRHGLHSFRFVLPLGVDGLRDGSSQQSSSA